MSDTSSSDDDLRPFDDARYDDLGDDSSCCSEHHSGLRPTDDGSERAVLAAIARTAGKPAPKPAPKHGAGPSTRQLSNASIGSATGSRRTSSSSVPDATPPPVATVARMTASKEHHAPAPKGKTAGRGSSQPKPAGGFTTTGVPRRGSANADVDEEPAVVEAKKMTAAFTRLTGALLDAAAGQGAEDASSHRIGLGERDIDALAGDGDDHRVMTARDARLVRDLPDL